MRDDYRYRLAVAEGFYVELVQSVADALAQEEPIDTDAPSLWEELQRQVYTADLEVQQQYERIARKATHEQLGDASLHEVKLAWIDTEEWESFDDRQDADRIDEDARMYYGCVFPYRHVMESAVVNKVVPHVFDLAATLSQGKKDEQPVE